MTQKGKLPLRKLRNVTALLALAGGIAISMAGCGDHPRSNGPVTLEPVSANAPYNGRIPALKPCTTKSSRYPVPCVYDGEGESPTFWSVGTGKDNQYIVATVMQAQQEWQDRTRWLSIDPETANLLHGYTEPDQKKRDWTKCGQRIFYGNDSPSIIVCPDGYTETA